MRQDAERIARAAIDAVRPDEAVRRALAHVQLTGQVYLVAVGKAAWQMAKAALDYLNHPITAGIVLTKYGHVQGELPGICCYEAGHPVPDEKSFLATEAILDMTQGLAETDTVLFLLSGGGSALFEKPRISPEALGAVTQHLLSSGADIVEINTIRKRLSHVKGGRFALWCAPARIEAIILSDILGDRLDMIASGPAAADPSTSPEARAIAEKYGLSVGPSILMEETPKVVTNVHSQIIGSVRQLCMAARDAAAELGYDARILTDHLDCEASQAGRAMAQLLAANRNSGRKLAFIEGGETVVHLTGTGLGGRNQELALSAAEGLAGIPKACVISVGSDGTDGPTDAAGGYVDGNTLAQLAQKGIGYDASLQNNDSYHALDAIGNLIKTGPTGTNVNDVTIGLLG